MVDVPKTALLSVTRKNQGEASYSLYIDGVAQKLDGSSAHWDDASPWPDGTYALMYQPFKKKWPAWLLDVLGRSAIKIHRGSRTDHSQGCIVLPQARIDEVLGVLKTNKISRNDLVLQVSGVADFGFRIMSQDVQVVRGGQINLEITLAGAMSNDGVSKDIWVHVNPDGTAILNEDFTPAKPQQLPKYRNDSSYPVDGPGFWIRIPKQERSVNVTIDVKKKAGQQTAKTVKFLIDGYKIVNVGDKSRKFYTPSNYRTILNQIRFNSNYIQIR